MKIEADTTSAEVDAAFGGETPPTVSISDSTSPADLVRLVSEMQSFPSARAFLEQLASLPLRDHAIWRAVLRPPVASPVALTALNNPTLPVEEVSRLEQHPSEQVRGHAFLANLHKRLPTMDDAEFSAVLDAHQGDEGISLGVRHLLARSDETPRNILERLADDDADFVADCARRRLERHDHDSERSP